MWPRYYTNQTKRLFVQMSQATMGVGKFKLVTGDNDDEAIVI